MKRPGSVVYFFGNPVTLALIASGTAYLIYQWWANQGSPALAFIGFLAVSYSASSNEQLRKHNDWKREWDAMGGKAPSSNAALLSNAGVRVLIVFGIWCIWAYLIFSLSGDPGMKVAVWLFWLTTVVMVVGALIRLFRRSRRAKPAVYKDVAVSVCLPVPKQSPTAQQAFAALPQYCRQLFSVKGPPVAR